jgi:pimeloyl-ACP methyl ester carboxylesterase
VTSIASDRIEVRRISIEGQSLQVALRHGERDRIPLLLFNGIGANWELAKPFLDALTDTPAIIFDVPGIGGSSLPSMPYRPSTLARLAAGLVAELGYSTVDAVGVSWGGGIAQQFARQYPKHCRRLVLAATSSGAIMVPARLSVLWKMATPRRYTDKEYMRKVAPLWRSLSPGSVADRPACKCDAGCSKSGLFVSTSCHDRLDQSAMAAIPAAANACSDGQRRSASAADQWPDSCVSHTERVAESYR